MTLSSFTGWMVCGLIVGLIARLVAPGREDMGLLLTMVLGIVGAVVGGLVYTWVQGTPSAPMSFTNGAWLGWVVSILGAVLVVTIYAALARRSA